MKILLNFSVSFVSYFIQCNKLIIFMCDTICGLKFNGMFRQVLEEHNQYDSKLNVDYDIIYLIPQHVNMQISLYTNNVLLTV